MEGKKLRERLKKEVHKVIIGQEELIDFLLVCLVSNGHALVEGVPGLAKTLTINAFSKALDLSFSRIQFTPDLMPSDITGTDILEEDENGRKRLVFVKGPVFSNIVLADEINRAPPKTQSALLEAMQERKVTVLGKTYELEKPFMVMATQNPIEQEGTYPLPEAQMDRFLLMIKVDYPSYEEEVKIATLEKTPEEMLEQVKVSAKKKDILKAQQEAEKVFVAEKVAQYVVDIVRNTRPESEVKEVKEFVRWGAGPRAARHIIRASRAVAYLKGLDAVSKDEVDTVLIPALRHRIILNIKAKTERVYPENIIETVRKFVEKKYD